MTHHLCQICIYQIMDYLLGIIKQVLERWIRIVTVSRTTNRNNLVYTCLKLYKQQIGYKQGKQQKKILGSALKCRNTLLVIH